ncbi:MAG: dihydrolipoamide acetyltransferase family protein [Actinobacteria bacterium]|nr:dihydrolipoamide acetyltransferase family protein [Actinomycetota bacterium]
MDHVLAPRTDSRVRSPLVRRLLAQHSLDPATISGTGSEGRITRDDVLRMISNAPEHPMTTSPNTIEGHWEKFSGIRAKTGERMLLSHATIPQVTTIISVDYENIARVRAARNLAFKSEFGFSLTYLPFIAYAVASALREYPKLNASVEDKGLRVHPDVDLGIAVDINHTGLMVPVVWTAQDLSITALARQMQELANGARDRKLSMNQITGSTFTITNVGAYGTIAGTPIINPPEVAILCVEGISKQPVVVEMPDGDTIGIHHMGALSLSWDHRAIDGAYAGEFLARTRTILQTTDWSHLV